MSVLEQVAAIRERYVEALRRVIGTRKKEGTFLAAEVMVRPSARAGQQQVVRFDLFSGTKEDPRPEVLMNPAPTGALLGAMRVGTIEVAVFPFNWEACVVWLRHKEPDWSALREWFHRWFDEAGHEADEDGLSGVVHYMSEPVAEGGGYLLEIDFGSAPVEAFSELLGVLDRMGASEVRIGMSDGSDMEPAIAQAVQAADLTPARLTELAAELLGTVDEVESVRSPGALVLEVRVRGGKEASAVFLENLWRRMQQVPAEQRPLELARFIRSQRETQHSLESVPDLETLRPLIKDTRFIEQVNQQMKTKNGLACARYIGDLWIASVWDMPNGMRFVMAAEPGQFGLTLEEVHKRALENYLAGPRQVETKESDGVIVARTHDDYDASLLLDAEFWTAMQKKLPGEVLACVPSRSAVLITSTGTPGGEAALRALARRTTEGADHLISETILRRVANAWIVHAREELPLPVRSPPAAKRAWWKVW